MRHGPVELVDRQSTLIVRIGAVFWAVVLAIVKAPQRNGRIRELVRHVQVLARIVPDCIMGSREAVRPSVEHRKVAGLRDIEHTNNNNNVFGGSRKK